MITEITSVEQVKELVEHSQQQLVCIFKHSTRCPTSSVAFIEFEKFAFKHPEVKCGLVKVLERRDVSNFLEMETQTPHQSPQVLMLREEKVVWTDSHMGIHYDALLSQI